VPMVLLSGCGTAISDGPFCPTLVPYSVEFQRRAAEELERLPIDSPLVRLIEDYGELRARIRGACGRV